MPSAPLPKLSAADLARLTAAFKQVAAAFQARPSAEVAVANLVAAATATAGTTSYHGLNVVVGTAAANTLAGTAKNDLVSGDGGNDTVNAGAGNDIVSGGTGDDTANGEDGRDLLSGGDGNDALSGGAGTDALFGGIGNDRLDGGASDDLLDGGAGRDVLIGGDGVDTASYAHATTGVTVNLTDATGNANTGDALGDTFSGIETLVLTAFADNFVAGAAGGTVFGGDGADTLTGGAGVDVFHGGAGVDRFVFGQAGSAVAGVVDKIMDFRSGEKIDLSRIDAVAGGTDNAFSFVDTRAFSGVAGELRVESVRGGWLVTGDVNGDKTADFQILVAGNHHPVVADFVL